MGRITHRRRDRNIVGGRMTYVGGVLLALSLLVSLWAFSIGDVVTGLGMGLFVVVGALFVAIGRSPDPATPPS
jgi:hypothetical protein